MPIIRLDNVKIREDIPNDQVLVRACNSFGIHEKYVTDYKVIKNR